MMKSFFTSFFIAILLFPPAVSASSSLAQWLPGRILLAVESAGEAFYVDPEVGTFHYMGRPVDAFALMREKGLGIAHAELEVYIGSSFPERLSGYILLDVEQNGEAYYVDPLTLEGFYLGRPANAFDLMGEKGLGVSTNDLLNTASGEVMEVLGVAEASELEEVDDALVGMESDVWFITSDYRNDMGLNGLLPSDDLIFLARAHSQAMAEGSVEFVHDGFDERASVIVANLEAVSVAENVAYSSYEDPVDGVIKGWIASEGHRENIEGSDFTHTGVGVAQSDDGIYYFTQIFAQLSE